MKYADDAMVACVFREVPKNGKILEFEFLDERFANFFSFAGFDFVSLSSDEKLVKAAKNTMLGGKTFYNLNDFDFSAFDFDCLLCHLFISYTDKTQNFIENLKKILQANKKFIVSALSPNDSRAKNGIKGFESSELKELFKDFKNLDINLMQTTYENKSIINEYFIITGKKHENTK